MVDVLTLLKTAIILTLKLSAPILIAAVVTGIGISLVQTLFQIQDQTLPFALKLVVVGIVLLVAGAWIGSEVMALADAVFKFIPDVGK